MNLEKDLKTNLPLLLADSPKFSETRRLAKIYREASIIRGDDKRLKKIADQMSLCGRYPENQHRSTKAGNYEYRNIYYHCGHRQCPPCHKMRNQEKREKIEQMLLEKGTKNFIFLTLTTKRYPIDGCREHFDFLSSALTQLMKKEIFKSACIGTFRSLEGNSDRLGNSTVNPHAHLLIESSGDDLRKDKHVLKYIYHDKNFLDRLGIYALASDKSEEEIYKTIFMRLKKGRLDQIIWSALALEYGLGDICYVKEVKDYKGGVYGVSGELCKYLTKSMTLSDFDIVDFYSELFHKNMVSSTGTIKEFNKNYVPKKVEEMEENGIWRKNGSCEEIMQRALKYKLWPDVQAVTSMVRDRLVSAELLRELHADKGF